MRRRLALAALALGLSTTTVFACGFCVEDRLAAVYDHELVGRALGARGSARGDPAGSAGAGEKSNCTFGACAASGWALK